MNLYTVVTGEIREGDLCSPAGPLVPVPSELIGKNAKIFSYYPNGPQIPVFRPVKVPSEEELDKAVPCAKTMTCPPDMPINTTCIKCHRETMLRLMGLEPEQAK